MGIHIEGVEATKASLRRDVATLMLLRKRTLGVFAKKVRNIARETLVKGNYMDTGALHDSLHEKLMKETSVEIEVDVIAGDENVVRGAGRYAKSSKWPDIPINVQSTTEYAEAVELGHWSSPFASKGPAGYMKRAYDWGLVNIKKEVMKIVRRVAKDF